MFKKYFSIAYLFGPYPVAMSRSEMLFAGLSVVLLILSAILFAAKHTSKDKLFRHLATLWLHVTLWIGLLGLLWAGLRYETVEYLSANVIVLVIFVIGIVWALCIVKYQLTTYRRARLSYSREKEKQKYL